MKTLTLVYKNGGEGYLGEWEKKSLYHWKELGKELNQKYMYKGYRDTGLFEHWKRDIVVVFDIVKWSGAEKKRRKANGFLGIREYELVYRR